MKKRKTRKIRTETKKGYSLVDLVGHRARRLKAVHPRSYYKSDKIFINAVYMHNKNFIDSHLERSDSGFTKRQRFVHLVEQYVEQQNISAQSAVDIFASSESMTTASERMQMNITKAIKKNPTIYKEFKKKLDLKKKEELDPSKFIWDYFEEAYEYDGYYVQIDNSPKEGNYTIKIYNKKTGIEDIL